MSRKISIIGTAGARTLSLLARADVSELVLVDPGAHAVADEVAEAVAVAGSRRRVHAAAGLDGARGSEVVVFARAPTDAELADLARTAPDAVLVVGPADVDRALGITALPRPRVLGAADGSDSPAELAAAVLLDRNHVVACVVRCQGEAGLHGTQAVRARVGGGGVREIVGAA